MMQDSSSGVLMKPQRPDIPVLAIPSSQKLFSFIGL
jgi:hypothetical protein